VVSLDSNGFDFFQPEPEIAGDPFLYRFAPPIADFAWRLKFITSLLEAGGHAVVWP
jgi:hypothetical protein